jgi:RNA polymerase sigma factor (sigma-70 family)
MNLVMAVGDTPESWSDQELLAAVCRRDGDALAAFYRRHLPAVLSFLLRETADRELAADLTAEVFAAVMLAAPRYRPEHDSALPWLLGIARNVLGASRRRGRVEVRARERLGFEPLELEDADLERAVALADEGRGEVSSLVRTLPQDEREAVEARVVEQRTYAEIAGALRCSELVVRKRVSRGLARLREQLKET